MAFRNVILIINLSQNNFIGMQPLFSTSNWHLENLKDKHQDIIDLYVDEGDSFSHYSASLITNWRFECVYVKIAHKRKSKIAMVRFQKFIDIFMVDSNGNLLKYFSNPSTNWQYKENEGCSIKDINPSVNPIAFRFPDQYHIICVELNGDLILVQSGRHTAWANQVQSIRKGKNISGLSGIGYQHSKSDIQIGYQPSQSDIFFIEDGSVVHGKALKDGDNWKYAFNTASDGPFQNITACARCKDFINFYCLDYQGTIHHYKTSKHLNSGYNLLAKISTTISSNQLNLTALQSDKSFDLFYLSKGKLHRLSSSQSGLWIQPAQIDQAKEIIGGISAVRNNRSIFVFYITKDLTPKYAYLTADNGWIKFSISNLKKTLYKYPLQWRDIQNECVYIESGRSSNIFKNAKRNVVFKIFKRPILEQMQKQVRMLNKVSQIYPNMCQYQIEQNGVIVGFSMRLVHGQIYQRFLQSNSSLFQSDLSLRITIILKLAQQVIKLQNIRICHGEISLANLMIHYQQNSNFEDIQVGLIDYGDSFNFDETQFWIISPLLTPPQCSQRPCSPFGVNSYQFGRVALQILLGETLQQYNQKLKCPQLQLGELKDKYAQLYPKDLIFLIEELLSKKPQNRIQALYKMKLDSQIIFNLFLKLSSQAEQKQLFPIKRKALKIREKLDHRVDESDDFLTHHLKHELSLSQYASKNRIQRRQILQHIFLRRQLQDKGNQSRLFYLQIAICSWMQRIFLDIWQKASEDLLKNNKSCQMMKISIAEQYMFEIYQLKEFIDAGLGNIYPFVNRNSIDLFDIIKYSDKALMGILKKLGENISQINILQITELKQIKNQVYSRQNILNNFSSKCFQDPININIQNLYDDLSYILKIAREHFIPFQSDMKDIFGSQIEVNLKVKEELKETGIYFNASAVRRVLIKWTENIIDQFPQIKMSQYFIKFIRSKAQIANNFIFKSTNQQTTHNIVIKILSEFIEQSKYSIENLQQRSQFGFNIFDLLRCKTKRSSTQQITQLFKKIQNLQFTKSGKKFQITRTKNRLSHITHDILVNFRYGNILVGEVQLCIDQSKLSQEISNRHKLVHFVYQLQRCIFGPTLQLMMQYEDSHRSDISVNFNANGLVQKRELKLNFHSSSSQKVCFNGHKMTKNQKKQPSQKSALYQPNLDCEKCIKTLKMCKIYYYCYYCSIFLCQQCAQQQQYRKIVTIQNKFDELYNLNLQERCRNKRSLIVLFYKNNHIPSQMFKDSLIYYYGKINKNEVPQIALADCQKEEIKNIAKIHHIRQFPSLILFDSLFQPIRTIIGYSWLQMPFIIETYNRLIMGQQIGLTLKCIICRGNLSQLRQPRKTDFICVNCNNKNNFFYFPHQQQIVYYCCSQNHYYCISCSYAAMNTPSIYKDNRASRYLTNDHYNPKINKCLQSHATVLVKAKKANEIQYTCSWCLKVNFLDDKNCDHKCEVCDIFLCSACMVYPKRSLKQQRIQHNLAFHYVESTAEEIYRCLCNKHFKKVYKSRHLMNQIFINKVNQVANWRCASCNILKQQQSLELFLSCFDCQSAKGISKQIYINFSFCLKCLIKNQYIIKQEKQQKQILSKLKCERRHFLVKTSLKYPHNSNLFLCNYCNRQFFIYSERFYCKTCKTECCIDCVNIYIGNYSPYGIYPCSSKHKLIYTYIDKKIKFCNQCKRVIKKDHFICQGEQKESLCVACVLENEKKEKILKMLGIAQYNNHNKGENFKKV